MRIDVLKDRLRLTSILDKALHGVGDESVGEHVGDVVKVLGNNVGGATKVELSQLARLIGKKDSHIVMNSILCTCTNYLPFGTSQRRTRPQGRGIESQGLSLTIDF